MLIPHVGAIYAGSNKVIRIYQGNKLVYGKPVETTNKKDNE